MVHKLDYSTLDIPEIIKSTFYPRNDWEPPPQDASDHLIEVAEDVHLSCRLFPHNVSSPSILLFHGNGEVVSDYNSVAPLYNREGINLFVIGYRGYGLSGGAPSFSSMMADALIVVRTCCNILKDASFNGPIFVMGRSLGRLPAIEVATFYSKIMSGLIVESGSATISRFMRYLGYAQDSSPVMELEEAHQSKISMITLPLLVIHGEQDTLVPISEASHLYQMASSMNKRMITIGNAGHNDLMYVGRDQYFEAIRCFVA